jgi:hypothetical protein
MADAVDFYAERIESVLAEDRPQLEGRDFSVAPTRRDAPDTAVLVARLSALAPEQWRRVGLGSSDGAERDIRNLVSRLAHECHHHTLDMRNSE